MDDKLQAAINRGVEADVKLKDPFLNECLNELRLGIISAWTLTTWQMKDEREQLWHQYQAMLMIRSYLVKCLNDGKVARADLDRILNLKGP